MLFSRQFRALAKLAGLWALPWCLLGAGVGIYRAATSVDLPPPGQSLAAFILTHVVAIGCFGLIAGLGLGLALVRVTRSDTVTHPSLRRVVFWGSVGGAAPAALFATLGLLFGESVATFGPLLTLGIGGAVVGAGLSLLGVAVARHRALPLEEKTGTLPEV
jgi:hypothetical protein